MRNARTDVAIIGGGVAGLTAAYRLAKAGVPFRLFEAAHHWGGLVRTERADGFLLDAGPDTLLAHRPEAIALCRDLALGDRLMPAARTPRTTYVVHNRRLHELPEGMISGAPARLAPFVRTGLFTPLGKMRMAMDLAIKPRRDRADESIASFFRRRLGAEALDRIGQPLLAGIHGGDAERLSLRSTFPTLLEMEAQHGSLIRAAWSRPLAVDRQSVFFSLPNGVGELVESMVLRLRPSALTAGVRVASIRPETDGFEILPAEGPRLHARRVILATPLWETARLLAATAPGAAGAIAPIRFTSSVTVFLGYRRSEVRHPLDAHGLVIPRREGLRTRACTFSSSKYPGRAPDDFVLLKGYLGGLHGAEALGSADAALAYLFEQEMRPLLGIEGRPVVSRVYRWPGASPQMEVGHSERVVALQRALAETPELVVIGAGVRGSGIPNSVADGNRAAAEVLQQLGAAKAAEHELTAH